MDAETRMLKGMRYSDLDERFFQTIVENIKPGAKLVQFEETSITIRGSEGVLSSFHGKETNDAFVGLKAFRLYYKCVGSKESESEKSKDIVLKVKKEGAETHNDWAKFFGTLSEEMIELHKEVMKPLGLNSTLADLHIHDLKEFPSFKAILPTTYHIIEDKERHIYAYVMDNFSSPANGYSHLNFGESPEKWSHDDVVQVLKCLANVHATFLGNTSKIPERYAPLLDTPLNHEIYEKGKPYVACLHEAIMRNKPEYFPEDILEIYIKAFDNTDKIFDVLDKAPKTLIHGDCTIRNMCQRNIKGQGQICVYDWEAAQINVPQHDFIDFMQLWLPVDASIDRWYRYLDIYRNFLKEAVILEPDQESAELQDYLEWERFKYVTDMCFLDYFMLRSQLYMSASILIKVNFVNRCKGVWHTVLRNLKHKYDFLN